MAFESTETVYVEKKEVTEFIGNPLIAALSDISTKDDELRSLIIKPPYRKEERDGDPQGRLDLLGRISAAHYPLASEYFIARNLSRCIKWGYVSRNPVPFRKTAKVLERYERKADAELERYLRNTEFPTYGFSVLGISGVGKSSSVLNVARLYPQVIKHTEYEGDPFICSQLVWLKVNCPSDGSPKGLCTAILLQMDAVLGTSYHAGVTSRISKDVLTTKVSQCLRAHYLGVLIIDDIQNLCGAKADMTSDMLSFLIYLMETLAIPVVMVGTPKVLPLFQKEFQLAKRATGDGTVRMGLLEKGSMDWSFFINMIWSYQFTKISVPLTPELETAFFNESVGNPFLCSLLYKLVQDFAITSKKESFTEDDVKKVAKERLCITNTMREHMLAGTDEELNRYELLWTAATMPPEQDPGMDRRHAGMSGSKSQSIIAGIAQELIKHYGIDPGKAEKLAKEAFAATPGAEREEILGLAAKLYEAAFPPKAPQAQEAPEKS